MDARRSCARLRQGLRVLVERARLSLPELAEALDRSPTFLPRLLAGRARLRVEEVFHLLSVLEVPPAQLFFGLFPLGGEVERSAMGGVPLAWEAPGPISTRRLVELARQRPDSPPIASVALALLAGRVLKSFIQQAGTSQRAVAEALGISPASLGRALRGQRELKFELVFAVLEVLVADPGRYFIELLGPDPDDVTDGFRWTWWLDQTEEKRRASAAALVAAENEGLEAPEGEDPSGGE